VAIDVRLKDGMGDGNVVSATPENSLCTQDSGLPVPNPLARAVVFRQFLTVDGTATGSNDMQVDGGTTPVEFWVQANQNYDLYIANLSFVIADASATLNKFGNITALTTGCDLEYFSDTGTITVASALKSNFDFVRLCLGNPPFGDGAGAFRASNVESTSEGYIPVLDFKQVFALPWGIRLRAGTTDKVILRVNDLTTGVDAFNCIAYGFTREAAPGVKL
jgi:hypothetical protein